jgi:hypothetical protein
MPQPFRTFDLKNFAGELPKRALHKQGEEKVGLNDLNDDPLQRLAFPANDRLILYSTDYAPESCDRTLDTLILNLESGSVQARQRGPALHGDG